MIRWIRVPWVQTACVLCWSLWVLFYGLGREELTSADEAIHAQVSREMLQSGNGLFPTYRGEPYLEKPPLKLWLTTAMYEVFGVHEWTARFWSALFGLGTIVGVMQLGRRMFNHQAGLAAGWVLSTTWDFLFNHCARTGEMDSALLCFMTWMVYGLWRYRTTEGSRHLLVAALCAALGTLSKGHVALWPVLWIPFVWKREPHRGPPSPKTYLKPLLVYLLVIGLWILLDGIYYGTDFFRYVFFHHLHGYMFGNVEPAKAPLEYYNEVLLWLNYPWPPIALTGLIFLLAPQYRSEAPGERRAGLWLGCWTLSIPAVLWFSNTKLPWYHLPIWIPLSLAAGSIFSRWWQKDDRKDLESFTLWLLLHLGLLMTLTGLPWHVWQWCQAFRGGDDVTCLNYYYYFIDDFRQRSLGIGVAVVALLPVIPVVYLMRGRRGAWKQFLTRGLIVVVLGVSCAATLWEIGREHIFETSREIVSEIIRQVPEGEIRTVHIFDDYSEKPPHYAVAPSLYFYLKDEPRFLSIRHPLDQEQWMMIWRSQSKTYDAILPIKWYEWMPKEFEVGGGVPMQVKLIKDLKASAWVRVEPGVVTNPEAPEPTNPETPDPPSLIPRESPASSNTDVITP